MRDKVEKVEREKVHTFMLGALLSSSAASSLDFLANSLSILSFSCASVHPSFDTEALTWNDGKSGDTVSYRRRGVWDAVELSSRLWSSEREENSRVSRASSTPLKSTKG